MIGRGMMIGDVLERKEDFLDFKKYRFHIVKKSVITQDFRQKFELSSLLVFIENRPNNDI